MKKYLLISLLAMAFVSTSCVSTRNTIKNIDDNAIMPALNKEKNFIITETSNSRKYAYDQDYPINLGFLPVTAAEINVKRFFGALAGPEGQALVYKKVDSCCPFPSKKNEMGAGILDIYEVTWDGLSTPKKIYINLYEKGKVLAPQGLSIKPIAP